MILEINATILYNHITQNFTKRIICLLFANTCLHVIFDFYICLKKDITYRNIYYVKIEYQLPRISL